MEYKHFKLEKKDGIAIFTIDRSEVRNALNTDCWDDIDRFVDEINGDDQIGAAIITGAGEKAFVSGADINMLKERTMVQALTGKSQAVLRRLSKLEKPVLAAVNGVAFGGGCELALACDIRIASENAKFALPELGLGVIPGAGGTQRLSKLVGLGRASEMILTGRVVSAAEALRMGLVSNVFSLEQLMEQTVEIAKKIMEKGPLAVRLAKRSINASMSSDEESGMMIESLSYALAISSADKNEGTQAFLEKRKPVYRGK